MKYITLGFYILFFIYQVAKYGVLLSSLQEPNYDYAMLTVNFVLVIYWSVLLWRAKNKSKNEKLGKTIGMVFLSFVYVPLVAFSLSKTLGDHKPEDE